MTQNDNFVKASGNLTIPGENVNGTINVACKHLDNYGDIGDSTKISKRKYR